LSTQPISLGVKWSEITVQPTTLPEGVYTFTLLGGKTDENNGRTTVSAAVAEGEFTGKPTRFSYPNFQTQEWALTSFKRLTIALGMDIQDGEDAASYLNRAAGQQFIAKVAHRASPDDPDVKFADVKLNSVRPV